MIWSFPSHSSQLSGCCSRSNLGKEAVSAPHKSSSCRYQELPEISIMKNLARLARLRVSSVYWVTSRLDADGFLLVLLP